MEIGYLINNQNAGRMEKLVTYKQTGQLVI